MNSNPRFGPKPGERVRVQAVMSYPLPSGLKDRDVVLLKSWDVGYTVEFEGKEYRINQTQIMAPLMTTSGQMYCPDCKARLWRRGHLWVCSNRTCPFQCKVDRPANVMDDP
jgi:hypothetical protein